MGRGAYIFSPLGPELSQIEKTFFNESDPFGFILFARHAQNPKQLRTLTQSLRECVGWEAPIFIDQEGGRVARLTPPNWTAWLPPLDDCKRLGDRAREGLYLRYSIISAELKALGIDANCSPVGDLAFDETHAILRNRCYGTSAKSVVERARAVANAHLDAGVLPVMKHMPGHGRANVDSHLEVPRVHAEVSELEAQDFSVFKKLSDLPIGMSAHVIYENLDNLRYQTNLSR